MPSMQCGDPHWGHVVLTLLFRFPARTEGRVQLRGELPDA